MVSMKGRPEMLINIFVQRDDLFWFSHFCYNTANDFVG